MTKFKNKILKAFTVLLSLVLVAGLMPGGIIKPLKVSAATISHNIGLATLTIPASSTDDYIITGTYNQAGHAITVKSGYVGTITLNGVNITTTNDTAAMLLEYGSGSNAAPATKVALNFTGINTLKSGPKHAGLDVMAGTQITINGTGTLKATGGNEAAGIGAGNRANCGGNVIIESGTINGYGGLHGAGIGGGWYANAVNVIILGGNITSAGGAHSYGIGKGCVGSTGTLVVLPPANIVSATGAYGAVGGTSGGSVYIGDPNMPLIQIKTEETTKNANIFVDFSNIPAIKAGLQLAGVDHTKYSLGKTDAATGILRMNANIASVITFFTDATTTTTIPVGLAFLAAEKAVTSAQTITLPMPRFKFTTTTNPTTLPDLNVGYTTPPTITINIKNDSNCVVKYILVTPNAAFNAAFTVLTPPNKTMLAVGETATMTVKLKSGLGAASYPASVTVTGTGVSGTGAAEKYTPMTEPVTLATQKVVKAPSGVGKGGTVTAVPAPDASFRNALTVALTANAGANNTINSWKYQINNSATPGASWATATGNSASVAVPATPVNGNFFIHWEMVNSNYTDTSGTFSTYKIDRTKPVVVVGTLPLGTVNANFDVKFNISDSEGSAAGLSSTSVPKSAITVTNGEVVGAGPFNIVGGLVTIPIKPSTVPANTEQNITVKINADAVVDHAGNKNLVSPEATIKFNNKVPTISMATFNDKVYDVKPASVQITVTPNYTPATLYADNGTTVLTNANIKNAISVTKDGIAYTTFDATILGANITLKGNGGAAWDDGVYAVTIAAGNIKNGGKNGNAVTTGAFTVGVLAPVGADSKLSANPILFAKNGGNTTLKVEGKHFKTNIAANNLKVRVVGTGPNGFAYNSGPIAATAFTAGPVDFASIAGVAIPANTSTTIDDYTFTLYYTQGAGAETNTGKRCSVQVEPDVSHIIKVTNTTGAVADFNFNYTAVDAMGSKQVIQIENTGAQELTGIVISFIGADGTHFGSTNPGLTTLAAGASTTVDVRLNQNKNAGAYAGGAAGSETKVVISAKQPDNSSISASAVVKKQIVKAIGGTIANGDVKANIQPSNNWSNTAAVTLTARAIGAGDRVAQWQYQVTNSATPSGAGWQTVAGGATTATHSFPANTENTWYIHWKLDTNNYTGINGTIDDAGVKSYKIDLIRPKVESMTTSQPSVGAGAFDVKIVLGEAGVTGALNGGHLSLTNCTFVSLVSGPTNVGATTEYVVKLKPSTGLSGGAAIKAGLNANVVSDKATNGNEASSAGTEFNIGFNASAPEVVGFSFTLDQEFPVQQTSVSLVIKPNGTANQGLKVGAATLAAGDPVTFVKVAGLGVYTAAVESVAGNGDVTIKVTGAFVTGDYTINVNNKDSANNSVVNAEANPLVENSSSFKVRIPVINPGTPGPGTPLVPGNPDLPPIPGVNDPNSFYMNPVLIPSTGGDTDAIIKGANLQNAATNLQVKDPRDGLMHDVTYSPDGTTATYTAKNMPPNYSSTGIPYTFEAYLNGVKHNTDAVAIVLPSVPAINDIQAVVTAGNTVDNPLIIDNGGGTVDITVNGQNLQAFVPLEIKEGANVYDVTPTGGTVGTVSKTVILPANTGAADIAYEFNVYADGAATGHTVTVTVLGSYPNIRSLTAIPDKHTSAGGTSVLEIDGIFLDNFTLLEVEDCSCGDKWPTTVRSNRNTADCNNQVVLPAWTQGPRNDIYDYEIYVDGAATGIKTQIEVGDSTPNITGASANPNYYPNVASAEKTNGKSEITIHGNYLFNYSDLQIYDPIYDKYYTVTNKDDLEAKYSVNTPTAEGLYTYEIFESGVNTGFTVEIGVGYEPGGLVVMPPADDGTVEPYNEDKEWKSTGGGSKGRGFTGRQFVGFEVLAYQCEQTAKKNPIDPIVTIADLYYISKDQIDMAAASGHAGARASEKVGSGNIKLIFDTLDLKDATILEGRLTVDISQPVPELYPGVFTAANEIKETLNLFRNKFSNKNMTVVSLGQNGSYGSEVEVAAFINLEGFNTKTLNMYILDREKGEYKKMTNTKHFVDTAGFLHFFTRTGGDVIITDQPLPPNSGKIN